MLGIHTIAYSLSKRMCMEVKETSSSSYFQLIAESDLSASEHAVKVRKPYIISKRREKWTEKEHNKFLEALKLYGRNWRRIEEHIESKTAVQIRSHAQKFFSKVSRESIHNGSAIEIPPPRPKKRPIHPYPRKSDHPLNKKDQVIDGQLIRTTASGTLNLSMPHVSSPEQISRSKSSSSAEYEGYKSRDCPFLGMQDTSSMELELGVQNCFASNETPDTGQQMTGLKLFGSTVPVADLLPKSPSKELEYQESLSYCSKTAPRSQKLQDKGKSDEFLGQNRSVPDSFYNGYQSMPFIISIPFWWDLNSRMPFGYSIPMSKKNQSSLHSLDDNFTLDDSFSKECSQIDSSTSSDSNSLPADKTCNVKMARMEKFIAPLVLKRSKNSAFSILKPSFSPSAQSFVPYKRCV